MNTKEQSKAPLRLDGDYPGLNGLSWAIGFLEQLLAIMSEPLLIGCAALAVVDFVTGGKLLALPFLMYTWAGSLAIAVTACFIVTWRRAIRAFTLNYYGVAIGLAFLGLALGIVDWAAIDVQSLQQTLSIPFTSALAALNLNIVLITHLRSAVAISMAVVVAVSNNTAVTTAQAPKRRLVFLEQVLNRIAPVVSDAQGSAQVEQQVITNQAEAKHPTRLHAINADTELTPLERVEQALSSNPTCSDRELGRLTSLAPATAKRYRLQIEQSA